MDKTLTERENKIFQLAKGLLSGEKNFPDDATIDAEFIFRFDPRWCLWVNNIRLLMKSLLSYEENTPLSSDDRARLWVHLEMNPHTRVGMINGEITMETDNRGGYHSINPQLRKNFENALKRGVEDGDNTKEIKKILHEIWQEANQTSKIQSEIKRLAKAYQLIPLSKHDETQYPSALVIKQYQSVLDWILRNEITPSFLFQNTWLIENKTDKGVQRVIRPDKWNDNIYVNFKRPKISPKTRIRTWTVYYLSKRGGGERTEQAAIDLWNQLKNDSLNKRNYLKERERLFKHESEKKG